MCPGSLLSWIHLVLDPFCAGSFLSCRVRSEMSALTRKYRARTWAMEWHWQRTTFPANGPKKLKNKEKILKKTKIEDLGSRLVQIEFWLGRSPWNFIFHRQGRINIVKCSIFDRFWKDKYTLKNCKNCLYKGPYLKDPKGAFTPRQKQRLEDTINDALIHGVRKSKLARQAHSWRFVCYF